MRRLICATIAGVLLAGTVASAASPSQAKGAKHGHKGAKHDNDSVARANVGVHVAFASADVTILRTHYTPRYRNLPPGLQKKVARGGALPPGWQKQFEPFPVVIERQLPRLPLEYRRGVIDGHAVIYNSRTNVIVDVAVLF